MHVHGRGFLYIFHVGMQENGKYDREGKVNLAGPQVQ